MMSTRSRFRADFVRFTFPFNALGWPALALPCGAAEDGLPASIQIVGRPRRRRAGARRRNCPRTGAQGLAAHCRLKVACAASLLVSRCSHSSSSASSAPTRVPAFPRPKDCAPSSSEPTSRSRTPIRGRRRSRGSRSTRAAVTTTSSSPVPPSFEDSSIVFKDTKVPIPAEAIARQLPWLTGDPYALWAHVRWVSNNGQRASQWSAPFGLNLQWAAGRAAATACSGGAGALAADRRRDRLRGALPGSRAGQVVRDDDERRRRA